MILNKRGALMHWIVFGIIAAIGLFLYLVSQAPAVKTVKGTWQFGLFYDGFFPAEIALQQQDAELQHVLREAAQELAAKGGFQKDSLCGREQGKNIWGEGCFPDARKELQEELQELFVEKLQKQYPLYVFSEITLQENHLMGKRLLSLEPITEKKNPPSSVLQYTAPAGFSFDLSPFLDAYAVVAQEAQKLQAVCSKEKKLSPCIIREKQQLPNWHFISCSKRQELPQDSLLEERKISFCVSSQALEFQFALDFTPPQAFAVEDTRALFSPEQNAFEIRFSRDTQAEFYKIYYTDFTAFAKTHGTAEEISRQVLPPWFVAEKTIHEFLPCQEQRDKGIAYLCNQEVVYLIDDARLTSGGTYLFWVTAFKGGKESEILFLRKVKNLLVSTI